MQAYLCRGELFDLLIYDHDKLITSDIYLCVIHSISIYQAENISLVVLTVTVIF